MNTCPQPCTPEAEQEGALDDRISCGDIAVPNNMGFRALKWRIKWKRKWKMKWNLGLHRGYLCSILFGDTMVPFIE